MRKQDKEGNDVSDTAADRGAEATDVTAAAVGFVYAMRHKFYKLLMIRIQVFIIKVRMAEKGEERKEEEARGAVQKGRRKKEGGNTEKVGIREARRERGEPEPPEGRIQRRKKQGRTRRNGRGEVFPE